MTAHPARLIAASLLAFTAIGSVTAAHAAQQHPRYAHTQLQRDLDRVQRSDDIVGLTADVDLGGREVRARAGTAVLGTHRPMPFDGEFRIASTTKTFVATVALQLVDEGTLSLDDTVARWLPGLVSGHGNDGAAITLGQLLGQRSGLFDYLHDPDLLADLTANLPRYVDDNTPATEWVRIAMKHRPAFAPGTRWQYSNTNYVLAALIIEKATGLDWSSQVEHRIIAPLHLRHTYYGGANPFLLGPHAHSYLRVPGTPDPIDLTDISLGHAGDAGLVSTTQDLGRFFHALVGGRLLSPASLRTMQTTVTADDPDFPGGRYGLGLRWFPLSCGGGYWGHEGDHPGGFHTRAAVSSDARRSVVVSLTSGLTTATSTALNRLVDHALCA